MLIAKAPRIARPTQLREAATVGLESPDVSCDFIHGIKELAVRSQAVAVHDGLPSIQADVDGIRGTAGGHRRTQNFRVRTRAGIGINPEYI